MSTGNAETVRQAFEAFNSEDLTRIVALAHQDILIEVPAEISAEPDTYRGHEGIRRYFESFQDAMRQIRFEIEELWEAGDSVVVALRLTAKGKQTDIPVAQRTAGVWTIQDGKIRRIKAYASTSQALEAVGVAQEARSQTP